MQITHVKIQRTFDDGTPLKAIASIVLDEEIAVHDIKIVNTKDRFFVVMPSRKTGDGVFRDIIHPISQASRKKLEDAVIDAYQVHLIASKCER